MYFTRVKFIPVLSTGYHERVQIKHTIFTLLENYLPYVAVRIFNRVFDVQNNVKPVKKTYQRFLSFYHNLQKTHLVFKDRSRYSSIFSVVLQIRTRITSRYGVVVFGHLMFILCFTLFYGILFIH